MNEIIELKNVSVRYKINGNFWGGRAKYYEALKSINFSLRRGETLAILGRNGAGKSTLLRVLSGIIQPDKGEINFFDSECNISLLALNVGLDVNLTGRENAYIGCLLQGQEKEYAKKNLDKIKYFSELGDFFDEPVRTYSTGMISRLGFAVATLSPPDILLLDEILSVGDEVFKKKALNKMTQILNSGRTIVLVTHSLDLVLTFSDRVIIIDDGVSVFTGNPSDAVKEYKRIISL